MPRLRHAAYAFSLPLMLTFTIRHCYAIFAYATRAAARYAEHDRRALARDSARAPCDTARAERAQRRCRALFRLCL